jgi:hypothetical protein
MTRRFQEKRRGVMMSNEARKLGIYLTTAMLWLIGIFAAGYFVSIALNISVGYRECKALAIHNDLDQAGPCAVAHAIRG